MSYYTVKEIYPWLHGMIDKTGVCAYLVIGDNAAILYDVCYGISPIMPEIRKITDKPVTVVLGHGHGDHANGAYEFDTVFMHDDEHDLFNQYNSPKGRAEVISKMKFLPDGFDSDAYINVRTPHIKSLTAGMVFDLGGITVDAIAMEGHTSGSIGLLVREKRVLLVGDATSSHVWMHLPQSLTLDKYVAMLERVSTLDFDAFLSGHNSELKPKSDFAKFIKAANNATIEKSTPHDIMPGLDGYLYEEDGAEIVFNARTRG